ASRVVELALKRLKNAKEVNLDLESHHQLAREAAANSAVLLKNTDSLLPLKPEQTLAVIGQFAVTPRYQGAGSSLIQPRRLDNPLVALRNAGYKENYADGYDLNENTVDENLILEAEQLARQSDVALVFAGLPDAYESEGFDRADL